MSQMLEINEITVDVTEVRALETRLFKSPPRCEVKVWVFFKRVEEPLAVTVDFQGEPDAAVEWCEIIKGELSRKKASSGLRY